MNISYYSALSKALRFTTYLCVVCVVRVGIAAPYGGDLGVTIDTYLMGLQSPLVGNGDVFFAEGQRWNVDPRLVVAISGQEQDFGRAESSCNRIYNAWSWFYWNRRCSSDPPASFSSWADGIKTVTKFLRLTYFEVHRATTIPAIGAIYCAEECGNWEGNVEHFYSTDLGGDPSDLTFGSGTFSIGDAVEITEDGVNVRDRPYGAIVGTQSSGATGTVTDGPEWGSPYWWWQVDFADGADGWVVEDYLQKVTPADGFTPWLSSSYYQAEFDRQLALGYYPIEVEGRNNNGISEYRGKFVPFPPPLFEFYSVHGRTQESYESVNDDLLSQGYTQIHLQVFVDEGGVTRYQATWTLSAAPPTYSVTPQSASVNEGDGSVPFTVSRSDDTTADTVYVSTVQNQGSTNNGDYVGKVSEAVNFAVGEAEQAVTVTIIDDSVVEPHQTFTLLVELSEHQTVSSSFTIIDNDGFHVSTDINGNAANSPSSDPSISANGRYVSFTSRASNLAPGDIDDANDLFIKDLLSGSIVLVSTDSDGNDVQVVNVKTPLSADGNYVAFHSDSSLVPEDQNNMQDVYVKDLTAGSFLLASSNENGESGNQYSQYGSISGDGRYVAFESRASNLIAGDTNFPEDAYEDVYVKDLYTQAIVRASSNEAGNAIGGFSASISTDGRYVAFVAPRDVVAGDNNSAPDIYVKDLTTGQLFLASGDISGNTESFSYSINPAISGDGRYVAFESYASLVPEDVDDNATDIYVKDLMTGEIILVSNPPDGQCIGGSYPSISDNGQYILYLSRSNSPCVSDVLSGQNAFIGIDGIGGYTLGKGISGDGRYIVFPDVYRENGENVDNQILVTENPLFNSAGDPWWSGLGQP